MAHCYVVSGPEEGTAIDIPAEYLTPVRPDEAAQAVIAISGDHRGTQRKTDYQNEGQWLMEKEDEDVMALVISEDQLARIWRTD